MRHATTLGQKCDKVIAEELRRRAKGSVGCPQVVGDYGLLLQRKMTGE